MPMIHLFVQEPWIGLMTGDNLSFEGSDDFHDARHNEETSLSS